MGVWWINVFQYDKILYNSIFEMFYNLWANCKGSKPLKAKEYDFIIGILKIDSVHL